MQRKTIRSRSRFETSFDYYASGLLEPLLTVGGQQSAGKLKEKELMPRLLEELGKDYSAAITLGSDVTAMKIFQEGVLVGLSNGSVITIDLDLDYITIGAHKAKVACISISGFFAVTGAEDGTVEVWNLQSRSNHCSLERHAKPVLCVAQSQRFFVSGAKDGTLHLSAVSTHALLARLEGHNDAVKVCQIPPNEQFLISASYDHTIRLWSLDNYSSFGVLQGHTNTVYSLALTNDGSKVVSSSFDHNIRVWNTAVQQEIALLAGHTAWVRCVILTPDEHYVVSGSDDNTLRIWSFFTYQTLAVLEGHTHWIMSISLTTDCKYIVSSSLDQTVRVWSFADHWEVAMFEGHLKAVNCVETTADCRGVVSAGRDGCVRVWNLDEQSEVGRIAAHKKRVKCVAVSSSGERVFSGSEDNTLKVWDLSDLSEVAQISGHQKFINALLLTPDNKYLVSGSEDSAIRLYNPITFQELHTLEGHSAWINCLAVSADSSILVSGSGDNTVRIWDLLTFTCSAVLEDHSHWVKAVAVSPDAQYIISGSYDNTIKVWDVESAHCTATLKGHTRSVSALCVLRTEAVVVSGSFDATIRLWSLQTMREVGQLLGHTDSVLTVVLTRDERFVVSGGIDCSVRVWSVRDMQQLAVILIHSEAVTSIVLSPDGKSIITGSRDCSISAFDFTTSVSPCRRQFLTDFSSRKELHNVFENQQPSTLFRGNVRRLRETGHINMRMASYLVRPYLFNSLHVCAYYNHHFPLEKYLVGKALFVRGAFGSPLTVALRRNTRKCTEVIIQHFVSLSDPCEQWNFVQELTEDLPQLLLSKSPSLIPFVGALFVAKKQEGLPHFIVPLEELPVTRYNERFFIREEEFAKYEGSGRTRKRVSTDTEIVEFYESLFAWNFSAGSSSSLQLLRALEDCDTLKVLTTPLIVTLVEHKWVRLWPLTLALTVLYGVLLALLVELHFYPTRTEVFVGFIGLNVFFLMYEGLQAAASGCDYFRDPWNYLDLARGIVAVLWGWMLLTDFQPLYNETVELTVVGLCFLRGFTYFRTFKMTRMFVRMILEVVKEMYSFLIILMYSTFAFSMIYAVLSPEENGSLFAAWRTVYEVNMGEFSNEQFQGVQWSCFMATSLVNIVIMLNLLISILGDAYERAQMSSKAHDCLEMLRLIIEYESLFFWCRSSGSAVYLMKCKPMNDETAKEEWEGRVNTVIGSVLWQLEGLEGRLMAAEKAAWEGLEKRLTDSLHHSLSAMESDLHAQYSALSRQLAAQTHI